MTEAAAGATDLLVVYGSETRLLAGLFERPGRFIRIYNSQKPEPRANCRDIGSIDDLDAAIAEETALAGGQRPRIGFVGAAFKTQAKLLLAEPMEDIEASVQVNILSYLRLVKTLLPHMIAAKFGVFVYLSSFRAVTTGKGTSVYSASKAFGEKLFEVLGKEYGRMNISTVSIRMGYFDGRMTDIFSPEKLDATTKSIASGHLGRGDDLVRAIEFALENRYLSSGVIDLNGGLIFD